MRRHSWQHFLSDMPCLELIEAQAWRGWGDCLFANRMVNGRPTIYPVKDQPNFHLGGCIEDACIPLRIYAYVSTFLNCFRLLD